MTGEGGATPYTPTTLEAIIRREIDTAAQQEFEEVEANGTDEVGCAGCVLATLRGILKEAEGLPVISSPYLILPGVEIAADYDGDWLSVNGVRLSGNYVRDFFAGRITSVSATIERKGDELWFTNTKVPEPARSSVLRRIYFRWSEMARGVIP